MVPRPPSSSELRLATRRLRLAASSLGKPADGYGIEYHSQDGQRVFKTRTIAAEALLSEGYVLVIHGSKTDFGPQVLCHLRARDER